MKQKQGLGFRVRRQGYMGIGLNSLKYGVLYLGSHYNTGPYINIPHFGNSNLGKLPYQGRGDMGVYWDS